MTTTGTALRADGFAFTWDTTRDHATLHHAGLKVEATLRERALMGFIITTS